MDEGVNKTARELMNSPVLAEQLARTGYCTFPFLGPADIEKLKQYYSDFQKEEPQHFYSSSHSPDYAFRKRTSDLIREIISPLLPPVLKSCKLLGGAFVVKPANGKGILQPHQDWNIVDETKSRSYNLWIPLIDVVIENGAVFVLPGSHNKIPTYRGPGIPSVFRELETRAWDKLRPLPMQAGEALLYDHALLHGSPANTTTQTRLGIVCGIIPGGEQVEVCFPKEDSIEIYKADENFFLGSDPMKGPANLALLRTVKPPYPTITTAQFDTLFLGIQPARPRSWLARLFG